MDSDGTFTEDDQGNWHQVGTPETGTWSNTCDTVGAYSVGDVDVWTCLGADGICYEATREHIVVAVTNLPTGSQTLTLQCLTCGQDREIALDSDGCVF